jgi:hypothetical protein
MYKEDVLAWVEVLSGIGVSTDGIRDETLSRNILNTKQQPESLRLCTMSIVPTFRKSRRHYVSETEFVCVFGCEEGDMYSSGSLGNI